MVGVGVSVEAGSGVGVGLGVGLGVDTGWVAGVSEGEGADGWGVGAWQPAKMSDKMRKR